MKNELELDYSITVRAQFKSIGSQYVTSNGLFIGNVLIAEYHWNAMRVQGDPLVYKVTSPIKGIRSELGSYETEDECKSRCVEVMNTFLKMLQKQIIEGSLKK